MKCAVRIHGIACCVALVLSVMTAASTAADQVATNTALAGNGLAINISAKSAIATTKPIVVALADPIVSMPGSRPSIPRVTTPHQFTPNTPAKFFTINQVLAKHKRGGSRESSAMLAALGPTGATSDSGPIAIEPLQSNAPFGLFTFRAPQGLLWVKWRGVEADIKTEAPSLTHCEAQPRDCSPAEARFAAIVKDARGQQGRSKLELVNRRVNEAIRYEADAVQWHEPDVWSAPLDKNGKGSFDTGLGDCEDYAIAKYTALLDAGMPAKDLRVLLVRDNAVHMAHAVLAARQEGHWLILDNRWSHLREDTEIRQFTPLFALDGHGVRLFAAPYASIQRAPPDHLVTDLNEQYASLDVDASLSQRTLSLSPSRIRLLPAPA